MNPWPTISLGEVASTIMGQAPAGHECNFDGNGTPFVKAGEFGDERPIIREWTTQPLKLAKSSDVLVCVVGATCGKLNLGADCAIGRSVAAIRPKRQLLNQQFLYAFLQGWTLRLRSGAQGSAQGVITRDMLESIPLPVPPLAEQERLVELLNKASALRMLRTQAIRRTANLIPSLFHEMFGRHINSRPIAISLDNLVAPKGWRWSRLAEVARLATGHTPSRRVPEYWSGDIPWISLTDIRALDGLIAEETSQSVTQAGIENSSAVKLPKGTVCFSRTASVGFVTVMGREMCTSQDFVNWVCGEELNGIFLMGALIQAREYLRSLASGSTHRTIYFPTVEQFCALVPPLSLQNEFADRATKIWRMQREQAASRRRLDDLFLSMLHGAFTGDL